MAKIPKNLSDKDMMVNFKEELTFENMFSDEPEVKKFQKKDKENLNSDDMDILEDMIVVAFNEAMKKVDADKEKKLNKYQGLAGMM